VSVGSVSDVDAEPQLLTASPDVSRAARTRYRETTAAPTNARLVPEFLPQLGFGHTSLVQNASNPPGLVSNLAREKNVGWCRIDQIRLEAGDDKCYH
jgi:hypothetical protein